MTDNAVDVRAENPSDLIKSLGELVGLVNRALATFAKSEPSSTEAAETLCALHAIKRDLSNAYDAFSGHVGLIMGNESIISLPNGQQVERKVGVDRKKWHHPKLATRVAERLHEMSVDMDSGEIIMTAQDMVVKLLDYAAISYWRVGKLGELGINPDHYCEQGDYRTSIIVREAKQS